jgi:hypothetical protein
MLGRIVQKPGDCTGIDGHPVLRTPHRDQRAEEGVYVTVGDRIFHGEIGGAGQRQHCLTDRHYKYVWFRLGGVEYLFDLAEDPREVNNLAGEEGLVRPWRDRLFELLRARGDEAVQEGRLVPTPYRPTHEGVLRAADPYGRRPY